MTERKRQSIYEDIFVNNDKIVFAKTFNNHRIYLSRVPKREVQVSKYLEFIYVIKGSINIETEIEERVLKEGNLHIVSPNIVYRVSSEDENNIVLYLQCEVDEFDRECNLGGKYKIINNYYEQVEDELVSLMGNIYITTFEKELDINIKNEKSLMYLNKIMSILSKLECKKFKSSSNNGIDYLVIDIIRNLPEMVKNHDDTNLKVIADEYNISYSYLSRTFKRLTGENYTDYLQKIRMNRAVDLLINSNKKILDISVDSGFTSIKTFNNVFKKTFDISPTQLRTHYKKIEDIRSVSPLYLDLKTQEYLGKIHNNNLKTRKLEMDDKFSIQSFKKDNALKAKGKGLTNLLELEYLMNSYPDFSELVESIEFLKADYIIMEIIYLDGDLYILRDSGKLVRLLDKDLNMLLISMNENDIKPVIRINYNQIDIKQDPENYTDFYENFKEKVKLMYYIMGPANLKNYLFEIYISDMRDHLRDSSNMENLAKHIKLFREIVNEDLKVVEPKVGIYFGEIFEMKDLQAMEELFNLVGAPKYIDMDINFEIIMSSSQEYIVNLLDDISKYFEPKFGEIPIAINFIYNIKRNEYYKEDKMIYNSLFILNLKLQLDSYGYYIKDTYYMYEGRKIKEYFTDKIGIKLPYYYFFKFISNMTGEIIEMERGLIVTKDGDNINAIIYEDYDFYFDNIFRNGMDKYLNTNKNIELKVKDIEGDYKISEYKLSLEDRYDENLDISRKLFLTITDEDKKLLESKHMPKLSVELVDFSTTKEIVIEKKPLDVVLIMLEKI